MQSISTTQRGFSIIELMLTITVMGILLGIAVPSFMDTVRNNRLVAQNNEFIGSLNIARSEALKRSGAVSVCASADQLTCSGSNDWTTGYIVFSDPNSNSTFDGTDELLQVAGATPAEFTLNASHSFLRFGASGMNALNVERTFQLVRTGCTGLYARRIGVSVVGRVSTTTVACP